MRRTLIGCVLLALPSRGGPRESCCRRGGERDAASCSRDSRKGRLNARRQMARPRFSGPLPRRSRDAMRLIAAAPT